MRTNVADHPGKVQLNLWLEDEDRELIRKAARLIGHNPSSFTRHMALIAARKLLARAERTAPRPAHAR